jgi:hypothetical protein
VAASGGHHNCARGRKSCGFASGGVRSSHGVAGAGARERGAPESPVFCGAKNAPKFFEKPS